MTNKLQEYRTLILSDDKAMEAFMQAPGSELKKHADHAITAKQSDAIKHFLSAAKDAIASFPGKDQVGKAPKWVHDAIDWIWGHLFG